MIGLLGDYRLTIGDHRKIKANWEDIGDYRLTIGNYRRL